METEPRKGLGALVFAATVSAVLFTVAVYSLGSDAEGGPGEFFGCGLIAYALAAFVVVLVFLVALAWTLRSLKERRWRGNRRPALVLVAVIAILVWALGTLAAWGSRQVRAARASRAVNASQLEEYGRLALGRRDDLLALALVQNPRCPTELLARLASADWPELLDWNHGLNRTLRGDLRPVLHLVARHANTSLETLESLADRTPGLAAQVARNPGVPTGLLERIAEGGNREAKIAVAGSARAPVSVLAALSRSPDWIVRSTAAGNERTGAAELLLLAHDPDRRVRAALLGNKQVPSEALAALALDPDGQIGDTARRRVARQAGQ